MRSIRIAPFAGGAVLCALSATAAFWPGTVYAIGEREAAVRLRSAELPALLRSALGETEGAEVTAEPMARPHAGSPLLLVWRFTLHGTERSRFEVTVSDWKDYVLVSRKYAVVGGREMRAFDLLVEAAMREHVDAVLDGRVFDSASASGPLAWHIASRRR